MANTTTGLFETLVVPSAIEAAQSLKYTKATAGSIFWDFKASGGKIGQTLNINIPSVAEGDAQDIGGGPLQPTDTDHSSVALVLDQHPSVSFVIKSWDDVRTPEDLTKTYMKPKLEALLRYINGQVCGLVTEAALNSYTAITGGADIFSRANLGTAWANLAGAGVPVYDSGNVFFITHPLVYANMMSDTSFYQESVVGINASERATQKAVIAPQLNAEVKFDQQFPIPSSGVYAGLFFHRYAIGGVVVNPPSLAAMGGSGVEESTIYPFAGAPDFPVQIQMQPSIKDQGTVINLHAMFGVKVIRKDHASFLKST